MDELTDTQHGTWHVETLSRTTYLIDLDQRRVMRLPGAPYDTVVPVGAHRAVPVNELPGDRGWLRLVRVRRCRVGERMRLEVTVEGRRVAPLTSTPVRCIRPAPPNPDADPREPVQPGRGPAQGAP